MPLLPAVVYVEDTLSDLDKIEPSGVSGYILLNFQSNLTFTNR